jgi:hypothetical protein
MEALGTSLGGGALKLEATQLKQIPIPLFEQEDIEWLARQGSALDGGTSPSTEAIDAFVIERIVSRGAGSKTVGEVNERLHAIADELCNSRQKRLA